MDDQYTPIISEEERQARRAQRAASGRKNCGSGAAGKCGS